MCPLAMDTLACSAESLAALVALAPLAMACGWNKCKKPHQHDARRAHRRHGRHGWLWVIGIILAFMWFTGKGPFRDHRHHWDHESESETENFVTVREVDRRDHTQLSPVMRLASADGRPVAALDIKVAPEQCADRGVRATDLAAGILAIVDAVTKFHADQPTAERGPELSDLEKMVVSASGERSVELREVARLSRRQPLGARQSRIGVVRVYLGGSDRSFRRRGRGELMEDVYDRLAAVQAAREEKGQRSYDVDQSQGALLITLPETEMVAQTPAVPAPPAPPVPPVEPTEPVEPAEPVATQGDDNIGHLVDAAVGWALGSDYDEVRRALVDAKREVRDETARAMAEARQETAAALEEAKHEVAAALAEAKRETHDAIQESTARHAIQVDADAIDPNQASKRPSWVDAPPQQRLDEQGDFVITGSTGPLYATQQEARTALAGVLEEMTQSYVDLMLGPGASKQFNAAEVRRGKRPVIWTGPAVGPSGMTYYEAHAMLRFGDRDHRDLLRQWRGMHNRQQALAAGVIGAAVLLMLATLLGYLKLDTATRGYYSGRLKLAAGLVALAVVGLATVAVKG